MGNEFTDAVVSMFIRPETSIFFIAISSSFSGCLSSIIAR